MKDLDGLSQNTFTIVDGNVRFSRYKMPQSKGLEPNLKLLLMDIVSQSVCLSPRGCMLVSLSATTLRMEICVRGRPQKMESRDTVS